MFMDATKKITALFDCDGVIVDTEGQYTVFWNEMGQKYVNDANFGSKVKGQTLVQIYDKYFAGEPEKQRDITEALNRFEIKMNYDYVPGIVEVSRSVSAWCENSFGYQFQYSKNGECLSCPSRV